MNPFPRTSTRPPLTQARTYPGFAEMMSNQCRVDGIDQPCGMSGGTVQCPNNNCSAKWNGNGFSIWNPSTGWTRLGEGNSKPSSIPPTPGLNGFISPALRQRYGNRPWANRGSGVIGFSSSPNEFAGPSVTGLSVTGQVVSQNMAIPISYDHLFRDMDYLLSKSKCSKFISDLIKVAEGRTQRPAYSYDATELIRTIATQTDPEAGYRIIDNRGGQGSAGGDIWTGGAIAIVETRVIWGGDITAQAIRRAELGFALAGLHETIHLAGGGNNAYNGYSTYYTDEVLADAAKILTGAPGFPTNPGQDGKHSVYEYGVYWQKQLEEHCLDGE